MILDIGMPDMSGDDVARAIRQESWGKRVLLLAVTGWGQPDDREKARRAGFDQHLTKPVDLDDLDKLLSAYLESKRP